MIEAPEGFSLVSRDPKGYVEGIIASVTQTQIGFYGSGMAEFTNEIRFDLAKGEKGFAVSFHPKGQFMARRDKNSAGRMAFHTQAQKIRESVSIGKYRGEQQNDWWIFAKIEE